MKFEGIRSEGERQILAVHTHLWYVKKKQMRMKAFMWL